MSSGGLASLVASLLMLALVASSFAVRRVPMKQTAKMALAWIAIFAVGLLLYGLFDNGGFDDRGSEVEEAARRAISCDLPPPSR